MGDTILISHANHPGWKFQARGPGCDRGAAGAAGRSGALDCAPSAVPAVLAYAGRHRALDRVHLLLEPGGAELGARPHHGIDAVAADSSTVSERRDAAGLRAHPRIAPAPARGSTVAGPGRSRDHAARSGDRHLVAPPPGA